MECRLDGRIESTEAVAGECCCVFFFNDTATTEIYTRSLRRQRQMCIRDRMRHSGHFGEDGVQGMAASSTVATGAGGGGISMAPVSYTHLRAHETVLDLVCRLLLEKQKRQHTV